MYFLNLSFARLNVILKSALKVWNIVDTLYFWCYLEMRCVVFYIITKSVFSALQCYLICNSSQYYRLNICLYVVVGSLSKCVKLLLDAKKITDVLNYRLGCRFDLDQWWCFFQSGLCCCIADFAHLRPDPTTQYLSSETGYGYE